MPDANNPTGRRMLGAHEKEEKAWVMRLKGHTYDDIAKKIGFRGRQGAHNAVRRVLDRMEDVIETERDLELARLDRVLRAIWPRCTRGNLQAIDRFLKLSDQRAKMLGLYKPLQIDITDRLREEADRLGLDPDAVQAEADQILREGSLKKRD